MTRVTLHLSPALSAYGRLVAERDDAPHWSHPGLSRALSRIVRRLGPILRDALPPMTPVERDLVAYALDGLLPAVRPWSPDEAEDADRLPDPGRIAAEVQDALPDYLPEGVGADLVRRIRAWAPMEVWAVIEDMAGGQMATAASADAARAAGRPRNER